MPYLPFYPPDYPGLIGPITAYLVGIPSDEGVGTLTASSPVINLTGIPSSEAFGTLGSAIYVDLSGFDASEPVTGITGYSMGTIPEGIDIVFTRPESLALNVSERFSSPIINQNLAHTDELDFGDGIGYNPYQEFYLPKDYIRGIEDEPLVPSLTGFQILTNIRYGYKDIATLDWVIERYEVGTGWIELGSGTSTGNDIDGEEVWFTVYTAKPISISRDWINDKFRIGLRGRDGTGRIKEVVNHDGQYVRIDGITYPVELVEGVPYHLMHGEEKLTLYHDPQKERVYASTEQGIDSLYAVTPNPLEVQSIYLCDSGGNPIVGPDNATYSLNFRILSGVAESGTDMLGNKYRSVVVSAEANNANVNRDSSYWLSKPNPSRFAVESLYFDITDGLNRASVIDSILVDPITTGIHFNVYYTNEGEPSDDDAVWERKLWTRLPQNFFAQKKDTHKLIKPINAKYIKIEFTDLQPRYYSPGNYQRPISYKKHPKWVLDYFLLRLASENLTEDKFIGRNIEVSYNAYDLAYNYYYDDIRSGSPDPPLQIDDEPINDFLALREDASDEIDSTVSNQIATRLKPFAQSLSSMGGRISYLPITYRTLNDSLVEDQTSYLPTLSSDVSTLDRDPLYYERGQSAMYFFITCRHRYRIVEAKFENDKGYFAGINEIAFLRDRYMKDYDSNLYIEGIGDNLNIKRNDFRTVDDVWVP